jgi:hypothetical protein
MVAELRAAASRAGVRSVLEVDLADAVPLASIGALYFCALDAFERAPAGTPVEVSVRRVEGAVSFEVVAACDLGTQRRACHDRIEAFGGVVSITSGGDRTTVAGSLPLS